jgi:enoyl-CoA hydratase
MLATLLTKLEDGILTITINRPDKLNALNKTVFQELDKVIDEVYEDNQIKSVIITGAGNKAFVAGADITEFTSLSKEDAIALSKNGQRIFSKIENCPKPVIAAINGFALGGGCELAMACHFRLCSDNAKFGQPEVNLGLIPGFGATQRLTQLIGKGKSMELQMTANIIDAQEALQLKLVNYVVAQEELLLKANALLSLIHSKAPLAISGIISCINAFESNQIDGYEKEANTFGGLFETEDMKEGISAFIEKRKVTFKGA